MRLKVLVGVGALLAAAALFFSLNGGGDSAPKPTPGPTVTVTVVPSPDPLEYDVFDPEVEGCKTVTSAPAYGAWVMRRVDAPGCHLLSEVEGLITRCMVAGTVDVLGRNVAWVLRAPCNNPEEQHLPLYS